MGKIKRVKGQKLEAEKPGKHPPLANELLEDDGIRASGRSKIRRRQEDDEEVGTQISPTTCDLVCISIKI